MTIQIQKELKFIKTIHFYTQLIINGYKIKGMILLNNYNVLKNFCKIRI